MNRMRGDRMNKNKSLMSLALLLVGGLSIAPAAIA
jgi:hypothetical protein